MNSGITIWQFIEENGDDMTDQAIRATIPVFSNTLGAEELEAVQRVMASHWLGMGQECELFEQELAHHFNVQRLLLVNNATEGIYLALRCLDLQPNQEVIVPTIHFVACAGAVLEAGATPIFADVDPETLNITDSEINRRRTDKTAGVIINHYGGHPAEWTSIHKASEGLWILEDAANAPYSQYKGTACGTLGDAGIWSFDAMKILSMADGGGLWFRSGAKHKRAWRLRNCGLDSLSGADKAERVRSRWWEFTVPEPYRRADSNDLLACIGRVQLRKLHKLVSRRKEIWEAYKQELNGIGDLQLPPDVPSGCRGSYYLFWIKTIYRDELARFLYDNGIYTTFRYHCLHKSFHGFEHLRLPIAEQIEETTLNIPLHQNLASGDVEYITDKIKEFFRHSHEHKI